jgi:dihydrofolate synthase/folylpolyglutamate synthase
MGGRLDAVNAIDADAALIVSIDLDHMEWLGPDRNVIGREKAGIVRAGRPAIVADRQPPAGLLDEIEQRGGDVRLIGTDFEIESFDGRLRYRARHGAPRLFPRPGFGGRIQVDNAAAVVAVVDSMQSALSVDDDAIVAGLQTARIKGRFERLDVAGVEWVFDVAHNPAAAALFHQALCELEPVARTIAVFGAMADKDLEQVLIRFVPAVDAWFVGGIDSERGADPAQVAALLTRLGARHVATFDDIATAAQAALADSADRVLAFGSFYTVGPSLDAVAIY